MTNRFCFQALDQIDIFLKYLSLASSIGLDPGDIISFIASCLSLGRSFLTKLLSDLFFFRIKLLIDFVIQGACRDFTVITLLGIKLEKIFKRVSVSISTCWLGLISLPMLYFIYHLFILSIFIHVTPFSKSLQIITKHYKEKEESK